MSTLVAGLLGFFVGTGLPAFGEQARKRLDSDDVLRLIFEGESLEFRARHRVYRRSEPSEFSNGAIVETRWSLTDGGIIEVSPSGRLEFPNGAVLSKQFSYHSAEDYNERMSSCRHKRVIPAAPLDTSRWLGLTCPVELRILIRRENFWEAHVYAWTDDRRWKAVPGGTLRHYSFGKKESSPSSGFDYVIPSVGDCVSCHLGQRDRIEFAPIGMSVARLDSASLAELTEAYSGSPHHKSLISDLRARLNRLPVARKYLDANCGFCHNPNGLAASSGLTLDWEESDERRLGLCKRPVAVSISSSRGRFDVDPGHPERSIMIARMSSREPGVAMPEFGRSFVDSLGVALISEWIGKMGGRCDEATR